VVWYAALNTFPGLGITFSKYFFYVLGDSAAGFTGTTTTATMASGASETEMSIDAGLVVEDEDEDEALRCIIDGELEISAAPISSENEHKQSIQPSPTPPLQVTQMTLLALKLGL